MGSLVTVIIIPCALIAIHWELKFKIFNNERSSKGWEAEGVLNHKLEKINSMLVFKGVTTRI